MDYVKLSKKISYVLRHAPWEYELELDEQGWVSLEQLLLALRENRTWQGLNEAHLREVVKRCEKKRFEITEGKIRALYGHSVPQKIVKLPDTPPETLYHGTARRFIPAIREKGLLPQSRQYVHLSVDRETAKQVGGRHDAKPVLLEINALQAWNEGFRFYFGNQKVWLADTVPSCYIHFE